MTPKLPKKIKLIIKKPPKKCCGRVDGHHGFCKVGQKEAEYDQR